ncbi:non-ribosomal peptide synthetase [Streptomyces sp. NPDC048644]|uniref:non-ribosomal peptide synthetase n=1 Tax=Streptomyces sp. NPDC048644 TaxID=3365582 RepID=UPI00371A7E40
MTSTRPSTTHGRVELMARTYPRATALISTGETLNYAELDAKASGLARILGEHGVGPGTTVAVRLPRCVDQVVATLAIWKRGGACVPVDPLLPSQRAERLLALSGAQLSIGPGCRVLPETAAGGGHRWFADAPEPERIAYVFFTSGSSGEPKAVGVPHSGIVNEAVWTAETYRFAPFDTVGSWLSSPGFAITRWELWSPLGAGAAVAIAEESTEWDAEAVRTWLLESGVTWSVVVTRLGEQLMALPWPDDTALRVLITGGEQLRSWPGDVPFDVVNSYGITETSGVRLVAPLTSRGAVDELPPIGDVIDGTQAHVLDDAWHPVPDGETGELYIGGIGLARGYLGRPGLTAATFLPDPFAGRGQRMYRTGDLVRRGADGQIRYVGRNDGEKKTRGVRLNPAEVEAALLEHPAIDAAAVRVRSDAVIAYVVCGADDAPPVHELRGFLAERLHPSTVPKTFVRLAALPTLLSGKTDRAALPEPGPDNVITDTYAAASGAGERAVAEAFGTLLGAERVGRDDDFFALGGDSLGVARLMTALTGQFRVEVPAAVLFEERTPRRIAAALRLPAAGRPAPPDVPPPPGPTAADEAATTDWLDTLSDDEVEDLLTVIDRTEGT